MYEFEIFFLFISVRKLRGSGEEEGGRFSDFTDDSTDDILNQAEPQQVQKLTQMNSCNM